MKVALLITGQIRTYRQCMHVHKSALIDKYDTDVFLSIDLSNTNQTAHENPTTPTDLDDIKNIIDFYKPLEYYICNDSNEMIIEELNHLINNNADKCMPLDKIKAALSQYYIVQKAYNLLDSHIKKSLTKYDTIIRLRVDSLIYQPPNIIPHKFFMNNNVNTNFMRYNEEIIESVKDLSSKMNINLTIPNKNEISVCGWVNNYYVNEQFWIHGEDLIKFLNNIYNELPNIIIELTTNRTLEGDRPYNEVMFNRFVNMHSINKTKTDILVVFSRLTIN
jgi:hypothetical protein